MSRIRKAVDVTPPQLQPQKWIQTQEMALLLVSQTFHGNHRTNSHVVQFTSFCFLSPTYTYSEICIYTLSFWLTHILKMATAVCAEMEELQCMIRLKPENQSYTYIGIYVILSEVLQPEGLMVITEKVDVPEVKMTPSKQNNTQTPNGLRVRHPLFGCGNVLFAGFRT
jgi:hypothetical protein